MRQIALAAILMLALTPAAYAKDAPCRDSHGKFTKCMAPGMAMAPKGATAKCKDGTYSMSQHHSGTCSHHGGVSDWLK